MPAHDSAQVGADMKRGDAPSHELLEEDLALGLAAVGGGLAGALGGGGGCGDLLGGLCEEGRVCGHGGRGGVEEGEECALSVCGGRGREGEGGGRGGVGGGQGGGGGGGAVSLGDVDRLEELVEVRRGLCGRGRRSGAGKELVHRCSGDGVRQATSLTTRG